MKTSGHLKSNGGIRGHSAGELFPFIVYAQGFGDNMRWCIKKPNGKDMASKFRDCETAHIIARKTKERWELGHNV